MDVRPLSLAFGSLTSSRPSPVRTRNAARSRTSSASSSDAARTSYSMRTRATVPSTARISTSGLVTRRLNWTAVPTSWAISWVRTKAGMSARSAQRAQRCGGLIRPDLLASQALQDAPSLRGDGLRVGRCRRLSREVAAEVIGLQVHLRRLLAEAERAHQGIHPSADGRVADAELALHLLQIAPGPQEALEQGHLVTVEATEAPDPELALQRGAAAAAVQAGDGELTRADRAGGDDVVGHLSAARRWCGRTGARS